MTADTPGVYLVTLDCTSLSPTRVPVDHPFTSQPSGSPTVKPIAPSQAQTTAIPNGPTLLPHPSSSPTTFQRSVLPTKSPTKRPLEHTSPSSQTENTRETD
eukprot:411165_1